MRAFGPAGYFAETCHKTEAATINCEEMKMDRLKDLESEREM